MYRQKVAIIGSGWGGLTCAYILQRNGFDVTIYEQGTQFGGCLQCFSRRGAKFETGMHFIGSAAPGQTIDRMMHYLQLSDDVQLSSLDPNGYDTVCLAGDSFKFPVGQEAFIEQMAQHFPAEKDSLARYCKLIHSISSASTLHSLASDTRDEAIDAEYQTRSMDSVLDELFHDYTLKNVLAANLPLYSAERGKTPFAHHAFIRDFYNQSAYRIVGGSDAIAKSLVKTVTSIGGTLLTGNKVTEIACNSARATGIVTEDGQFHEADIVISTIHPARTLELLVGTNLIRPAFRKRINAMSQTAAVFAVYLKFKEGTLPYMNTNYYGYAQNTPWGCEHYTEQEWPKGFLYMHTCHQDKAEWAKSGVILSYMNFADTARWQGTRPNKRGEDYEIFKQSHAEKLLAEVEKHFPGLASAIECYYTSTPLTYFDYTGTEGGSMYGVQKDITLGAAGRVPYRTKIPNLLLAGQNVNSHGMLGVLVGTMVTCCALVPAEEIYKQIQQANGNR